jgi:hypothetical protein
MTIRTLVSAAALAAMCSISASAQTPATKSAAKSTAKKSAIPRTADGHPDFEGVWTNATITPLTRPSMFKELTVSDAVATAYEKKDKEVLDSQDGQSDGPLIRAAGSSGTGGYNVLFVDRGTQLARVDGQARTSLIIDPPSGQMPPMVQNRPRRRAGGGGQGEAYAGMSYDSVKSRPLSERCLIGFGSTSGPPMMPVLYNNNYQIVQTPGAIMIAVEMVHDVRVIRMNAQHEPSALNRWLGDSVGHWEGDTLVVETINVNPENRFRGASDKFKVTERFQRVDASTILYRATIEDPETWTQPWTVEFPFVATPGPVYEYACHEGNYAMDDILGGARKQESTPKQ